MIMKKQNILYDRGLVFKCLLEVFWILLPRDVLETQSEVCGGAFFAKIVNKF